MGSKLQRQNQHTKRLERKIRQFQSKDKTKNCKGVAVAVVKKLIRKKEGKVSKH